MKLRRKVELRRDPKWEYLMAACRDGSRVDVHAETYKPPTEGFFILKPRTPTPSADNYHHPNVRTKILKH